MTAEAPERADLEADWWQHELERLGMTEAQADRLAHDGCDRHAVRVALEQKCDPDVVFDIFS